MARSFDKNDAKRLAERVEKLQYDLKAVSESGNNLDNAVKDAVDRYVASELIRTLRDIPVEELNRDKDGIRISALKDAHLNTLADVYSVSASMLASLRGISDSSAYAIKSKARDYAEVAKKGIKIKLSSDKKDSLSTGIVKAVCSNIAAAEPMRKCAFLAKHKSDDVRYALEDLKVGQGTFSWLFAGKSKKAKAEEAYFWLNSFYDEFGPTARAALMAYDEALDVPTDEAWARFTLNSPSFFNVLEEIAPGVLGSDDALYGLPEDLAREIQEECFFPEGLLCTPRRYQEWGVKYILHQERVLLGDEMGLGKTIQAIAAMVSLRNTGATHFLVICPASVLENWCREIAKHSLLRATKVHGPTRKRAFEDWQRTGGVAVTTYETVQALNLPDDFEYSMTVVDEAHYIKNPNTKRTKSVVRFCQHSERLLFMTGTALENKVDEMVSLISILQPNVAKSVSGIAFLAGAQQFRDKVAPVYYRRKRQDVLTELPELIENKEWCTMGAMEEEVYQRAVLSKNFMASRRVSWNIDDLSKSCKARRLYEIICDAEDDDRKVIVFSFFLDTAKKVARMLGDKCVGVINGSVPPAKRQEIIESFDDAPAGSVLVAQIQSGGTGLNIQAASVVVICEPQFKPSIENQAISRAYRMGQTRNVLVYRLLCTNTVDERITDLLEHKQRIFDAFADKSSAAAAQAKEDIAVDEKKFGAIIEEEIELIKAKNPKLAAEVEARQAALKEASALDKCERDKATACPACGKRLSEDALFCAYCGTRVV